MYKIIFAITLFIMLALFTHFQSAFAIESSDKQLPTQNEIPFKLDIAEPEWQAGCFLGWDVNDYSKDLEVFASGIDESGEDIAAITLSWMDLNQKKIRFRRPHSNQEWIDKTAQPEHWVSSEGVTLQLYLGKSIKDQGGGTYRNARLTIKYKGQAKTVKLKGHCGC